MSERLPIKYGVSLFLRGRLTLSKLVFYLKNLRLTVIFKKFFVTNPNILKHHTSTKFYNFAFSA